MRVEVAITEKLVTVDCANCGLRFALTETYERSRRRDHGWFYCPQGHHQHFPSESDEEKLRRERDLYKQRVAQRDDEIKRLNQAVADETYRTMQAEKATAHLKKRSSVGTCPCCKRTFKQLAAHMAQKHPAFVAEAA